MKESFIIHTDDWKMVRKLSIEQRGELFTALMCFQMGEELPELDPVTDMAFGFMSAQLERDNKKYEDIVEARSIAGKMGADARWKKSKDGNDGKNGKDSKSHHSQNGKNGKHALSVSVSDTVSDSMSVSVSDNEPQGMSGIDDTHTLFPFGKLKNVMLTQEQYDEITQTYQSFKKLIDKVSVWLPDHPRDNHFAVVHKFAINDDWPKKPKPEPPPVSEEPKEYVAAPDAVRNKLKDYGLEVL